MIFIRQFSVFEVEILNNSFSKISILQVITIIDLVSQFFIQKLQFGLFCILFNVTIDKRFFGGGCFIQDVPLLF